MNKACFIDLQGTLGGNEFGDVRTFSFFSFSKEALERISSKDYLIFIITNQSRIGAGYYSLDEYEELIEKIHLEVPSVERILCCPHTRYDNCKCKKPKRGMIDQILVEYDIDLAESYVIGDMGKSDMNLAKEIGSKSVLVLTGAGKSSLEEYKHTWSEIEPTITADNILEAVNKL